MRLINCARGGIYDEAALVEGSEERQDRRRGTRCVHHRAVPTSPLFGMPDVLATPHLGASTEEAQAQVAVEGIGLLVDFLTTGAIRHAVNMTPLDAKTLADSARLSGCRLSAGPAAGPDRHGRHPTLHAAIQRRSGRQTPS